MTHHLHTPDIPLSQTLLPRGSILQSIPLNSNHFPTYIPSAKTPYKSHPQNMLSSHFFFADSVTIYPDLCKKIVKNRLFFNKIAKNGKFSVKRQNMTEPIFAGIVLA